MFEVNHSSAGSAGNSYEPIPEGDYEVLIDKSELKKNLETGEEKIDMVFVVRNDVRQECQNRLIFNTMRRVKEPTPEDKACDGFFSKVVQGISKAALLPDGRKYNNVAEWAADLCGRAVIVTVKHSPGRDGRVFVNARYYSESKFPNVQHKRKDAQPSNGYTGSAMANEANDDDDCPF